MREFKNPYKLILVVDISHINTGDRAEAMDSFYSGTSSKQVKMSSTSYQPYKR